MRWILSVAFLSTLTFIICFDLTRAHADALPSWNTGDAKTSIIDFVKHVTNKSGPDFVPLAERIFAILL
jgi:hypothetical protein